MTTQLPQIDVRALGRALQTYRKLSPRHADEVRDLLRNDGWVEAAKYCALFVEKIEQNLTTSEMAPCELREETIGGLTEVWMADPEGVDQRRPEMVTLLRWLLHNGLSRYEPSPERACEAAEQRRRSSMARRRSRRRRRELDKKSAREGKMRAEFNRNWNGQDCLAPL
jgi:hypothetical protein